MYYTILFGTLKLIEFIKDIPAPYTQNEYNNRDFADQEMIFSSFSYLIDAAQILATILIIYEDTSKSVEKTIAEVDTGLVSWLLNLPKEKSQLVKVNGEVDELLFAAHAIINTYVLLFRTVLRFLERYLLFMNRSLI